VLLARSLQRSTLLVGTRLGARPDLLPASTPQCSRRRCRDPNGCRNRLCGLIPWRTFAGVNARRPAAERPAHADEIVEGSANVDDDRDYIGYGASPPDPQWPGGARLALNINVNFEGGGERSIMDGDATSEGSLNDIGQPALPGLRSVLVESVFEYGSRVGAWRLLEVFRRFGMKVCLLAVARAAERNPDLVRAWLSEGHELVSHHYRWLDYQTMPEAEEREHIRLAFETLERVAGVAPVGWMTGRPSANTRRLLVETGRLLYDRDSLNDELPYWRNVLGRAHLVIPYSFETNDNRFDRNSGFSTGDDFARYMIDCFDVLYDEGARRPRMMSLALHDRLIGRPGRLTGLIRFLDHVTRHDRVWVATGRDIAEHWRRVHPPIA
jgi:peptidoglycan/xylan/chitin deacetylase (PgdA/CDA1 family)